MTREPPASKKENSRTPRLLSPSLGVISLIPPPTPGLKGLRSGATGEYNSANIIGGTEIEGGGLRDGSPIALFPSATMITASSFSPSLQSTAAALSLTTTTPTLAGANHRSRYGTFPPSLCLTYASPPQPSLLVSSVTLPDSFRVSPNSPVAIGVVRRKHHGPQQPGRSCRPQSASWRLRGPDLPSSRLCGTRIRSPLASPFVHSRAPPVR